MISRTSLPSSFRFSFFILKKNSTVRRIIVHNSIFTLLRLLLDYTKIETGQHNVEYIWEGEAEMDTLLERGELQL